MARRQQAGTTNRTRGNSKPGSKTTIVRRHSKRLQRQQRDLPALQDLSFVTRDQASDEEDTPSILTQSGSEISLQELSSRVS